MKKSYRTEKGTELPILNLRGKEYLEVKYRVLWFREVYPTWSIETEYLKIEQDHAMAKATIKDESGRIIATSHKLETRDGFPDFIEKVETSAIGRALALIGFGTQFCADELDEGARIVDAPISPKGAVALVGSVASGSGIGGDYTITFGGKFPGLTVKQAVARDGLPALENYVHWIEDSAKKKNQQPSSEAAGLIAAFAQYETEMEKASR